MGIVARIALTYARGHDRLSAAAGGGDRPRRDAAWRQRGRCRGDVRIRAGRHRSTDVRPRRVRRDARARCAIRRGAQRVLRDGRVTRPPGPMGIEGRSRRRRLAGERLATGGPDAFYRGEIAEEIASDFEANDGFITRDDLASYRVTVTEPIRGTYRDLHVAAAGPPAGGLTLLQMLNFLEGFDMGEHGWPSSEAARLLVEAMAWAVADRDLHIADPRFVEIPTGALADKQYAAKARAAMAGAQRVQDRQDTTHVCVVDDAGNAVSLSHTLGSASGVVTPGLGFGFNDYMNCFDPRPGRPNSIRPGKTRVTMMTPTMVFDGRKLRVCAGAPGGTKIVTAILQVLVNVLDHEMSPVEAVSAPRVDFQGDVVQAEARIPRAVCDGLERSGYVVNRRTLNYDSYFARPQVIVVEKDGYLSGASDPRKDGGAAFDTETK